MAVNWKPNGKILNIAEEDRGVPVPGVWDGPKGVIPGTGEPELDGCPPVVTGEDETFVCPVPGVCASVETGLDTIMLADDV